MRSLVPFKSKSQSPTPATNRRVPPAINSGPITEGLKDLLVGFAAPSQGDEDKVRLVQLYAEAVCRYEPAIAEAAINRLKFHNPRNPFRPSPQDLFECCKKVENAWHCAVAAYFLDDARWGDVVWLRNEGGIDLGSVPALTPGCIVPDAIAIDILTKHIALRTGPGTQDPLEKTMSRERFAKIPDECFPPGLREPTLAAITRREEKQAKRTRWDAFLGTLRWDERKIANRIVSRHGGDEQCTLSEAEVLEKVRDELDREEREEAHKAAQDLKSARYIEASWQAIQRLAGATEAFIDHNDPRIVEGREKFAGMPQSERDVLVAAELEALPPEWRPTLWAIAGRRTATPFSCAIRARAAGRLNP